MALKKTLSTPVIPTSTNNACLALTITSVCYQGNIQSPLKQKQAAT